MSDDESDAVNCVWLTNVVVLAAPFHCTTEPETKPVPLMVRVNAPPAAGTALGEIELMTGDISSPLLILDHIPSKLRLADKIRAQVEACRVAKGAREVEME